MKLLYLNPLGQLGGAEHALLDIMSMIRSAQPSWDIRLLLGQDGPLVKQAQAFADQVLVLPLPSKLARLGDAGIGERGLQSFDGLRLIRRVVADGAASASYFRRLRATVAGLSPDVIHAHGFKMHLLGAWARPANAALVWHLHDYISTRPLTSRLLRAARRRCTAIVANSNSVAIDAARELGDRIDIRTIHNTVNLETFKPTGTQVDLDTLAGLPPAAPGTVRVGLVATFARWKGHLTFLESFAKLAESANVRGYVVGGPLYETEGSQYTLAELQAAARRLGVSSKVGFTGYVSDPAAAMRALDVVVHASTDPEPFGLVIAEAMATGRAVIVSFAGGARELVTPGVDALIHQPGDADELATAIAALAADATLRSRLGAEARRSALERFDPMRACHELMALYAALDRRMAA